MRSSQHPRTPLALELHRVVRVVALIAVAVGLGFFGVALLIGTSASNGFLFAVGVTVALVPEGLLPTVPLSLARGAQRLAARNALVRRLEAVETLGSTTFICTDKTGTLTRNEMAVVETWTPRGTARITRTGYEPSGAVDAPAGARSKLVEVARVARICSNGRAVQRDGRWVAQGDPMEAAIDVLGRRLGVVDETVVDRARFPFDPRRRRMSVVVGDRLLVKGAPDAVLERCARGAEGASVALDALAGRGLRVLAVAARRVAAGELAGPGAVTPDQVETDLELLGLLGFEDLPRAEAAAAVAAC